MAALLGPCGALEVMRIVDDRPSLLRAPEVAFEASEIGLPAFGYNVENRHLLAAFEERARELPSLKRIAAAAERISFDDEHVCIRLAGGGDSAPGLSSAPMVATPYVAPLLVLPSRTRPIGRRR